MIQFMRLSKLSISPKFKFFNQKKLIGRWNVNDSIKKINKKIDLSNEDHCGCCK